MAGGETEVDIDAIPEQLAREELERLLADPRFKVAERNRDFLRYITDARYRDQGQGIKSYSIAVDVFGRPESFDSQNDPIVRIEANRLRSGLDQFYEAYGQPGGLRIDIPKGRYVPRFTRIPLAEPVEERGSATEGVTPAAEVPTRTRILSQPRGWPTMAVAGASATAAMILIVVWSTSGRTHKTSLVEKPTVALMLTDQTLVPLHDRLLVSLSRFGTVRVVDESQRLDIGNERSYVVRMKTLDGPDERGVWWQIIDTRSSEVVRTGLKVTSDTETDRAIVSTIAREIAGSRGAISQVEAARSDTIGNPCILRAERTMDEGQFAEIASVKPCLLETLAADPENPDAAATFSRFLIVSRRDAADTASINEALDLATGALTISPGSDRAMIALMFAQFANGQIDTAIRTGKRAIDGNPDNIELAAKVGLFMVYAGRWEEGAEIANAAASTATPPRAALLALALSAYRRQDFATALALSERINCGDILVRALRVASSARLDNAQGKANYAEIKRAHPQFEKELLASLGTRRVDSDFARLLVDGVRGSGAAISEDQVAGL